MNNDAPVSKLATFVDSDMSSASPAASGSSDPADQSDMSSRTSTPSAPDEEDEDEDDVNIKPAPRDAYADRFSHSYRSTGAGSFAGSSVPQDVSYLRRWSTDRRPSVAASAAFSGSPYEQSDLAAAAAGLLSCSIGTPKSGPTYLQADIPPVPPLPEKYQYKASKIEARPSRQHQQDVEMEDGRSEEEDDGVFGTMEQ